MLALFVVVAILVVAAVAVLIVRDRPLIEDDPVGARALDWSGGAGVTPQDLAEVRFAVALRGYRMDEVDRVLDDTRATLASRDARVAELQRVIAGMRGTDVRPHGAAPDPDDARGAPAGRPDSPEAPAPPDAMDAAGDPSGAGGVDARTGTDSAEGWGVHGG